MKGIFLLEMDTLEDDVAPQFSLNAITGILAAKTMKLLVRLCNTTVTALIDSGSTHSFISIEAVSHLHLEPLFQPGLQVTVANGDQVASTGDCWNVKFCIDLEEFVLDFFVIPLAGYEMVHRVQWLHTLDPILWDFAHARMSCWYNDHHVEWHGVLMHGGSAAICMMAPTYLMVTLLHEFDDVFTAPTRLPPPRRHNHRIHLQPDMPPIVVRPYRYPQLIKDELERQCRVMLQQGIIRPRRPQWHDTMLLALRRYALDDHVLTDNINNTSYWYHYDEIVPTWMLGTLFIEL
jgi:hypothetical protein